ncbi:LPS-assembly protein LptD [Thiogranum longum]
MFAALAIVAAATHAEDEQQPAGPGDPYAPISAWAVCPPQPTQDFMPRFTGERDVAPTFLTGDLANRDSEGTLVLIGDAEAERADQRLRAERITYSELNRTIEAEGQVTYDEPQLNMSASHGTMWIDEDRGVFYDTRFRFYERHGRGRARTTYLLEPGITQYYTSTYTTCPDDSNAWMVRAGKVTIYEEEGVGVAKHARLNIKGAPLLYTPYLSFPIDDRRKSGFLVPSFGSSDNSGFELRVPYYLNLAPNYDATIAPRYLEDRGVQLNTEFRYLRPNQDGIVTVEYLPNDDMTGEDRDRITIRDTSRFGRHLTTNIDYDRVSDKNYLEDLGDSLSLASVTHLRRTARADYATNFWRFGAQIDDYQTIDETIAVENRPYQQLPRLSFSARSPLSPWGLETAIDSEFVRFDQDKRVTGNRLDMQPHISLPFRRTAFETVPKIGVRYTTYQLDNQDAGDPDDPTRTTPFFSLDNVVFFERNINIGSGTYMQTLEPRLFYLYVKSQNQNDIPLFDSSEPTFTYRELFEENRFNGGDRVGDANQAALAVTTRFLDPNTGAEKLRASLGQLFYFENRTVVLDEPKPEDDNHESDIAGELEIALSQAWKGNADIIWNPHDNNTERANARIQYNPGFRKIANLSYRYNRSEQNQIDASVLWPLTPSWHAIGRWYYDVDDTKRLETLLGIEYDSCCWGIRLVTRDFVDDKDGENNRIYLLQVVLKGLTRFGSDIESLLEDGILGYTQRPEN